MTTPPSLVGTQAWVLTTEGPKSYHIEGALYSSPHNDTLPRVAWPAERRWRSGWHYLPEGRAYWVHEEYVFPTLEALIAHNTRP